MSFIFSFLFYMSYPDVHSWEKIAWQKVLEFSKGVHWQILVDAWKHRNTGEQLFRLARHSPSCIRLFLKERVIITGVCMYYTHILCLFWDVCLLSLSNVSCSKINLINCPVWNYIYICCKQLRRSKKQACICMKQRLNVSISYHCTEQTFLYVNDIPWWFQLYYDPYNRELLIFNLFQYI